MKPSGFEWGEIMSSTRLRMIAILTISLFVGVLFVLYILGLICPAELVAKSQEFPVLIVRDSDFLCTGISQIVSDDEHIYVLYGKYSVIQVYTHDGTYCYSISVYNHTNGRTEIAVQQNCLYVCDKINNVYIFEKGQMKQFIDRHDSYIIRNQIPFGIWDSTYTLRSGSVWLSPDGVMLHPVIHRPLWLSVYQNDMLQSLMFVLIALAGAILFIQNPKIRN